MNTASRRTAYLCVLAVGLGCAGGAASWVLIRLIALLTNLALLHQVGWKLPSLANFHPGWWLIPTAMLGGLCVSLLARWSPVIRGHGLPEAMEAVLVRESRIAPRTALTKPTSAALAIGTGGPFGAEGPIIVTGGALGSLLGQALRVSPAERKILLAAGAAAGMAATFGAPLAAVVLAIELLLFEFSTRALVPLCVAASVAAGFHALYAGSGPLFDVPAHGFSGLGELPLFVPLGLMCGLLAAVICKGLFVVEAGYRRLPVHDFWHPIIGGALFAIVGLAVPRALGVGYDAINDTIASRLALGTLIALFFGKMIAWWFALGSGTSGGTLAPVLLIGATFGGVYYEGLHHVLPGAHVSSAAIVVVAMAAAFGASTRAVFTAIVFAFELTHDYQAIIPLIVAVVLADLVSSMLLDHHLMTEKLARRGLGVPRSYTPDALAATLVSSAMSTNVVTVPATATVCTAHDAVRCVSHNAFPVLDDDGRVVGVVGRSALEHAAPGSTVAALLHTPTATVAPDTTLLDALVEILEREVDHLPVVDTDGHLIGIVTRTDVLRARTGDITSERPQDGWLATRRRNRRDAPSPAT